MLFCIINISRIIRGTVYVTIRCPPVRLSVCLSHLAPRGVCCCGPRGQAISIDCCTARLQQARPPVDPYPPQHGGQQQMRAVSSLQRRRTLTQTWSCFVNIDLVTVLISSSTVRPPTLVITILVFFFKDTEHCNESRRLNSLVCRNINVWNSLLTHIAINKRSQPTQCFDLVQSDSLVTQSVNASFLAWTWHRLKFPFYRFKGTVSVVLLQPLGYVLLLFYSSE